MVGAWAHDLPVGARGCPPERASMALGGQRLGLQPYSLWSADNVRPDMMRHQRQTEKRRPRLEAKKILGGHEHVAPQAPLLNILQCDPLDADCNQRAGRI